MDRLALRALPGVACLVLGAATAAADCPSILEPGEPVTCELTGSEGHRFSLDMQGGVRIEVHNLGRGTVLSIVEDGGNASLRTANWRGPEHYYSAALDLARPVTVSVDPDEPIARSGRFRIRADPMGLDDPLYAAERAMTIAADRHLRYYYGEEDARQAAREQYLLAANAFAAVAAPTRQADALFEAAVVSRELGETTSAMEQLVLAEQIWTAIDDQRGLSSVENQRGLVNWERGETSEAIRLFEQAAGRRRALGDDYFYAESVNNLGLVYMDLGDPWLAIQYLEQALELWQGSVDLLNSDPGAVDLAALEEPPWLTLSLVALNNLGLAYVMIGEMEAAEHRRLRALELSMHLDRDRMSAELHNNLGAQYRLSGRLQAAKDHLDKALLYFSSEARDERWEALVQFNIGLLHRATGDDVRAARAFERALELRTSERDPVGRAEALRELAEIALDAGEIEQTLEGVAPALALVESSIDDAQVKGNVFDLAGRVYFRARQFEDALRFHDLAVQTFRSIDDLRGEARARSNRARTRATAGQMMAALAEFNAALRIARNIDGLPEQFEILTQLARTHLADGDPDAAADSARRGLVLSESVRAQLVHPALLRDFAAVQQDAYDVLIEATLRRGMVEEALVTADAARARRFIDLLRQAAVDVSSLDAAQRQRYESLRIAIAARAERRTDFLSSGNDAAAKRVTRDLAPLLDEMELLMALARGDDHGAREAVSLEQIQRQLRPQDTVLEYYIGESLAGVWEIDSAALRFHRIDDPARLAEDAADVAAAIRDRRMPSTSALSRLSQSLLAAAVSAGDSHLIVVPDGSLHLLPFALLPDPDSEFRQPLLQDRSVTYLPSLAALIQLRTRARASGSGIAVLADPVFESDDPRVSAIARDVTPEQIARLDPGITRGRAQLGTAGFPRLPGTLAEAEAIAGAAGDDNVTTLTGTDASREAVLSGELDAYGILHFATHGILDVEEPALSGLVLSGVTPDGRPQKRFLKSQDIVTLNLAARLVVLSGCDTGHGRAIRGEGLVGLSRAFFYAGAEQVISSLWQVSDRATAELMGRFYREMLENGQPPQVALRLAQLEVRSKPHWRLPFYWAAFVLQGDWL